MDGQPVAFAAADAKVERLAALWELHHERLYRLARRLTPSRDDALDLVQEAFLRVARRVESVPVGHANEEAWLVRVLVNIRRDQWRKTKLTAGVRDIGGLHPEKAFIARSAVWQALDLLPPRRRAVVVLYELEGLKIPAIAALLGIGAVTVRWHLSMGRRSLKSILNGGSND
jgi:RNA polymerase sigma-70 factor, ECF subfamily